MSTRTTQSRYRQASGRSASSSKPLESAVMRQVEPVLPPPFAVMGAAQQAIDQPLVGVRTGIGEKGIDLGGRRRQAGQVVRDPPDQRRAIGLGRMAEAHLLESGEDEAIDRVAHPGLFLHGRGRHPLDGLIGPVVEGVGSERFGRRDVRRPSGRIAGEGERCSDAAGREGHHDDPTGGHGHGVGLSCGLVRPTGPGRPAQGDDSP